MLPDSWQEIPVHKLKMCVYSRESSYFRFTLEKWSGDGNRNLAIQVYSLHNDKVCHVNTDRSQVYLLFEKNKGYKTSNIYANSAIVDLSQKPFCKVIHILLNQKDHTY